MKDLLASCANGSVNSSLKEFHGTPQPGISGDWAAFAGVKLLMEGAPKR